MTKTPYERAAAFLAEVDPRHQQKLTASIAPWIINRVAELLPPEPARDVWAEAVKKAEPEWGEPIPTPGDSCPEWLTLDLIRGNQFSVEDGRWSTVDRGDDNPVEKWFWQYIPAVRFPVGHPIYAQRQLEAAGYTVTPPAPPEPDYEAYRSILVEFYAGHGFITASREVKRGRPMLGQDRRTIKGLIAVGVKP